MVKANINGTESILKALVSLKERKQHQQNNQQNLPLFIYCSTQETIGPVPIGTVANEETPCNPQYFYGKTKLAAENLVKQYSEQNQLSSVILRLTGVTGKGDTYAAFEFLYMTSMGLMSFAYPGSCNGYNSFAHVNDVCDAFKLVMDRHYNDVKHMAVKPCSKEHPTDVFIIGPLQAITFKENIDYLCDELQFPKPLFHMPLSVFKFIMSIASPICNYILGKFDARFTRKQSFMLQGESIACMSMSRSYSVAKARQILGYKPMTVQQAFKLTIADELASNRLATGKQFTSKWLWFGFYFMLFIIVLMKSLL